MAYVIIGNSAAGIAAAEAIRKINKKEPLIMISDEPYRAYSRCLTTYYLERTVAEEYMYLRPPDFYSRLGIDLKTGRKVTAVNPQVKEVITGDGERFSYSKLLIATGASPKFPDLPGINYNGVFGMRTLDDAKNVAAVAAPGKKALVLGGGLVSLKTAAALCKIEVDVTVLVSSDRIMSRVLDKMSAAILESELTGMGVKILKGTTVASIEGNNGVVQGVQLATGEYFPADFVIVGKGVKPNTAFLKDSGLVSEAGEPLQINMRQETALVDIYAAGDVALSYDLLEEKYTHNAIWPNATEQGAVAGLNMAGVNKEYPGSISMNSAVFGKLSVIAAGITCPRGDDYWVIADYKSGKGVYKKLVLDDDRLVGYILTGDTSRAGLYTALIRSKRRIKNTEKLFTGQGRSFVNLSEINTV